ncbi:MAG: MFS transporter [Haloarculaceae archaeon]
MSEASTPPELRRQWTVAVLGYVAVLGVLTQLRGALLPSFADAFPVSVAELGLVSTAGSVGFLLAVVVAGSVVGRVDVRRGLLVALLALGACLALVSAAPTYVALLVGLAILGLSTGVLHGFDRPILSHLHPDSRGRTFNLQDMVWAMGATLGPVLALAAVEWANWRVAYLAAGVATLPLAVLVYRLELPASVDAERDLSLSEVAALVRRPTVAWLALAMLLLSFVEGGFFTWLPYYASDIFGRRAGTLSLTAYLAAYVPARYGFSRLADRVDNLDLVLGASLLATVMLAVAFVFARGAGIFVAVVAVGFLVAGMFPTLLARGTNEMPEYSGPMNAVALGSSSVGFLTFPATMGAVAEVYSVGTAMRMLIPVMLALAVLVAVVRARSGAAA